MPSKGNLKTVFVANLKASPAKSAVLAIAFVVLVIILCQRIFGGAAAVMADQGAEFEPLQTVNPSLDVQAAAATPRLPRPQIEPVVYRNPFSQSWLLVGRHGPADETGQLTSELQLQATLTKGTRELHSAIISGLVVHVGDSVAGYEVVLIADRRVELQNGIERIRLTMR